VASGDIQRERQFLRNAELRNQRAQCLTQVRYGRVGSVALAVRADVRPQLRVSAPYAVFVLLDVVGDMHDSTRSHDHMVKRW